MNWCPGINFLFDMFDSTTNAELQSQFSQHFFYPNICHVCNCHDSEVPLKKCGNCKMINYCSAEHQQEHWPLHKQFCRHVMILKRVTHEKNIETKMNLILSLENSMKRKLIPYENEMIEYQKVCEICLKDDLNLKNCPRCPHANFCQNHLGDKVHEEFCSLYTTCYLQDYYAIVFQELPIPRMITFTPRDSSIDLPNSMQEYLDIYFKSQKESKFYFPDKDVKMYVSQHFTRPLTLIYAMRKIDFKLKSELIIHVLGASKKEEKSLIEWEILFHWLPQETMKIKVVLIGPEMSDAVLFSNGKELKLCPDCFSKGKSLELQTRKILYENYCEEEKFVKPDILIGFNIGIIAYDSWENSILQALKFKCPLIFTEFSEKDAKDDQQIMKGKFNASATIVKNPFASLRPKRSVSGEKFFYENQFLMIFTDTDDCLVPVEEQETKISNSDPQNTVQRISVEKEEPNGEKSSQD